MKTAILSTLAVAALAGVAQADIVYATDFNAPLYSNGALIGQDSWVLTNSTTNPLNVANTGTNGNVAMTNNGQDARRAFPYAITSGSVYLTAEITITAAGAAGDYFLNLGDNTATIFNARIYARASGGGFQMAMGTGAGSTVTYGTTVLNFGQTYTILARYDLVPGPLNDTGALFINPLDPMGAGDTAYVAATNIGTDAVSFSSVSLRQGAAANAPTLVIDNISIVPTPGAAALLSVGILAAGRRRRA